MNQPKRQGAAWFLASMLLMLLVWEGVCRAFSLPPFILPPPSAVFRALWELREQLFGIHLWVTIREVTIGLLISVCFGIGLATAMIKSRVVERLVYPYIVISQTIPIIALSPVFILWFGYDLSGKVAVTILFTFFPVVVSMYDGLRSADMEMVNLLRTMGASDSQIFWKLRFPSSLPHFFSGLKVAATYSVAGATIGEWLGSSAGLGYFGRRASGNFQAPALFASVVLLSLLGIALFALVTLLERRLARKGAHLKRR
jgi:putative hydroxymethylpyrimidine transport system permease protein